MKRGAAGKFKLSLRSLRIWDVVELNVIQAKCSEWVGKGHRNAGRKDICRPRVACAPRIYLRAAHAGKSAMRPVCVGYDFE